VPSGLQSYYKQMFAKGGFDHNWSSQP